MKRNNLEHMVELITFYELKDTQQEVAYRIYMSIVDRSATI